MLLKNWMRGVFRNDMQREDGSWASMGGTIGNNWNTWTYTNVRAKATAANWQNYALAIVVGSGDTEVTYDDLKLDNDISGTLTFVVGSAITNSVANRIFYSITANYKNATDAPITVKELGIFSVGCIYTRSVLDTPVTINPGETYAFTYSIEI